MRGKSNLYSNNGECYIKDGRQNCYIDCDGGSFQIVRDGKDKMLIHNNGFSVLGCDADSDNTGTWVNSKPDDKSFRVCRLPAHDCKQPLAGAGQ